MQKIIVSGRLTRDAVRRQSKNGGEDFLTFTVASNRRTKNEDTSTFYDVLITLTHRIEAMSQYLTKGTAVIVTGDFSYDVFNKKDGTTGVQLNISADSIEFNNTGGKKEDGDDNAAPQKQAPAEDRPKPKKPAKKTDVPDDDMVVKKPAAAEAEEEGSDDLPF